MPLRMIGRLRGASLLILGVLALSMLNAPATAQGTSGTLPDPIGTRELLRYTRRLDLSDQQQRAVESFHDRYKQQFRVLRDGEIAAFLADMQSLQAGGMFPDREDVHRVFASMAQLNDRIATIDRRFFDDMQVILSDDQLFKLPRARKARERRRATGSELTLFQGKAPADLSDLLLDIELSPEERTAVDPILIGYENTFTKQVKKLAKSTSTILLAMFEALEERGIDESSFKDPEKMQEGDAGRPGGDAGSEQRGQGDQPRALQAESAHLDLDRRRRRFDSGPRASPGVDHEVVSAAD